MNTLPIITADQRLNEMRGNKGCIFGRSGIGKTSLLWTLDAKTTLFFDLEAGDLAVEGWAGDTILPKHGKNAVTLPALSVDQTRLCVLNSLTVRLILMRFVRNTAIRLRLINIKPSSLTQ